MLTVMRRAITGATSRRVWPQLSRMMNQSSGSAPEPIQEYRTQRKPVYTLPFYGSSEQELDRLPDSIVKKALSAYGGLIRKNDSPKLWRERLRRLTDASYRPNQLTIEGIVVSDKMDRSVVIAARRRCYSSKLQKYYYKTRRFMAHDEYNLCREGDRVIIRSCRMLSKHKAHVVVQNYGDQTRAEADDRNIVLEDED